LTFEYRCAAIEDEDGLDAEEEQFTDTPEETHNVRVTQSIAFFIAHCFEKLIDPDGGIDCEALLVEGREGCWTSGGREDGPEACDTHCFERCISTLYLLVVLVVL